jgi:dGTPase
MVGKFHNVGLFEGNEKWTKGIERSGSLYSREDDIRSEFARDYNRLLHCSAYSRLKHKTQVFFATLNDHICTRMEHVTHVNSVSYTIANHLGLNTELTSAIAIGHDLGHAPFGHEGETVIGNLTKEHIDQSFWHEKNSLRFIDDIETLEDHLGRTWNLSLTYAVRDGIICHCGEVDEQSIHPRPNAIDLETINTKGVLQSYSWEGCVVKISDKIAYLGRDIEDALRLNLLSDSQKRKLSKIVRDIGKFDIKEINNTLLIHRFIIDLCNNSTPDNGLIISESHFSLMNSVKDFNYENIYRHPRVERYKRFVRLVITTIFEVLADIYDFNKNELDRRKLQTFRSNYPLLSRTFEAWLNKYTKRNSTTQKHRAIYDLSSSKDYMRAVLDYLSGMTDQFALQIFNETIKFQ